MYSRYLMKRSSVFSMFYLTIVLLLLTGCMNSKASAPNRVLAGKSDVGAVAILKHAPSGVADLTWNPQSKELNVKFSLIGLVPKSVHPAHIHLGTCNSNGKVIYPLHEIVADDKGAATETTTIADVVNGIPSSGWSINVHNGPALSTSDQYLPIACGDVTNPHAVVGVAQSVRVWLGDTSSPNQAVSGTVQMSKIEGKLEVIIIATGLARKSVHAAHIHVGSCAQQGGVLYDLKPVVADASGKGISKTTLAGVAAIPPNGWYVNVHLMTNLSSQTGMDSIACGDVVLTH
jgi:predicted DNA-binding protein with PD1-like motif